MAAESDRAQRGIQSIEVGGQLLRALVHHGRPMALKDLAREAEMSAAKAHPYMVSFGRLGLIEQDRTTGHYLLGPLALQLGLISLQQANPVHIATPLAPALTPSLMILVAPFAVGFLAYVNIVGGIDRFAALLLYFALFMFAVVAPKVFRRGIGLSAAWWAIGFPMAALVNAALKYAAFRASAPHGVLAAVLLGLLSLALATLTVRTLRSALDGTLFA